MKRIVTIGGGFAGLWSTVGAVRKLDQLGIDPHAVEVTLVEKHDYHNIRVRNYEPDPSFVVPLDQILNPIGAKRVQGEVIDIDPAAQNIRVRTTSGEQRVDYDSLIY